MNHPALWAPLLEKDGSFFSFTKFRMTGEVEIEFEIEVEGILRLCLKWHVNIQYIVNFCGNFKVSKT